MENVWCKDTEKQRLNLLITIMGVLLWMSILSCTPTKTTDPITMKNSCDITTGSCTTTTTTHSDKDKTLETVNNDKKLKLIYYYDPLCGWCYGFSPVIAKVEKEYGDRLDIEVVSGGLFLGNRAGDVNKVAPHIKAGAYKSVEAITGVKFGETFLADIFGEGEMTLNSLPPTIALSIVKAEAPEYQVKFAGMLLEVVYYDGLDPIDIEGLADCAVKIGFDKEDFITKMRDSKYLEAAKKEFLAFNKSKYSGMPALVIEKNGQQNLLSHGYANFEEVKSKLKPFLASNVD